MSIQGISLKFKGLLQNTETQLAILIVVVSLVSFVLGRVSIVENTQKPQGITQVSGVIMASSSQEVFSEAVEDEPEVTPPAQAEAKSYVGSKNGTKYHLPWCGSAKQIKEENKVWFGSKEEAEKAGYSPASTCKGI